MSISGEDFKVNLTQSTINQQEDQLLVAKVFTVVFFFFLINFFLRSYQSRMFDCQHIGIDSTIFNVQYVHYTQSMNR